MQLNPRIGRVGACAIHPKVLEFSAACLSGIWLANWLQQTQAAFGSSLMVQSAQLMAVAIGILLGGVLATRFNSKLGWLRVCGPLALMAVWSIGFDAIQALGWSLIERRLISDAWTDANQQFVLILPSVFACLIVPLTALTMLLKGINPSHGLPDSRAMFGLVSGVLANVFSLAPLWGLQISSVIAACLGVFVVAATIWRTQRGLDVVFSATEVAQPANNINFLADDRWLEPLTCAAIALACVAMSRLLDQLAIAAWWYGAMKWIGLGCGVAVVGLFPRWSMRRTATTNWIAAITMLLVLGAFPLLIKLELDLNSYASIVWQHVLAQALIVLSAMLPLGLCLGAWTRTTATQTRPLWFWSLCVTFFVGAFLTTSWSALHELGVASVLGMSTSILLIAALIITWKPSTVAASKTIRARITSNAYWFQLAGAALVVAVMPFAGRNFDPALAAKLLFDTQTFTANRLERRTELLPHFDEGRLVGSTETESGTLTVWRYRGVQLQLRQSGLPKAVHSLDSKLCPNASAESLPAIMPLALHDRPGHVLSLGLHSGVTAETALQFPLQTLTCVESDRRLIDVVRNSVWSQLPQSPSDDERFQVVCAEPLLALAAQPASFDVIVSSPDQAMLAQSTAHFTSNFYRLAARALREDGLFCQRLSVVDCGLSAVQIVVKSCRSEFAQTAAMEVAPGEWILLATDSERGIFRRDVVRRLQRSHTRDVLARLGWDWASPFELTAINADRFDEHLAQNTGATNTATNCRLATSLPFEVLRWGDKYGELTRAFANVAQPMKDIFATETETSDVARRLVELKLQRELITENPDEYWAYRKTVKKRLIEQPQSEIVQVKGERPVQQLHANEKRRMQYFETLGVAAKEAVATPSALQNVESFAEPFDPLMSFFLHQEVAELAAKNRDANASLELQHRIHAAYFTAPNDRSIRNVIAAIELLCDRPELVTDVAQRGDHVDGLLQVLHSRWYARGDASPTSSKIALNDIEKSIAAVERANTVLEETASARGLSATQVTARQDALERSLIRPLRNYRQTLMPHHYREQALKPE